MVITRTPRNLFTGSIILIIAFGIFNVLNFAFHLFMARFLSVAEYGILATLFSGIYILAVFPETIQLVIAKYSARERNPGKLNDLLRRALVKSARWGIYLFAIYFVASFFLSPLLKIPAYLLILTGVVFPLILIIPVTRGIAQGNQRFGRLGLNVIVEGFAKLAFGAIFVWQGLRVGGALLGVIAGIVMALIFSFVSLWDIWSSRRIPIATKGIYDYSRPAFITVLILLIFYSIDVVIAKLLFSAEVAGAYAIASVISKSIFWGTQPISKAMFSLSAQSSRSTQKNRVLGPSLSIVIGLVFVALIIFFLFPSTIISIFSGKTIPDAASILLVIGAGMGLISIAATILLYDLSQDAIISAPKRVHLLSIGAVILLLLLFFLARTFSSTLGSLLFLTGVLAALCFFGWSFFKRYDNGLFLFVIVECTALLLCNRSLMSFSLAFLGVSAAFLAGTIFFSRKP